MPRSLLAEVPPWSIAVPPAACVLLAVVVGRSPGWALLAVVAGALVAAVLVAVHHAEVIAHRVGEPFGTLVLALAVTIIEVALIGSMMLSGGTTAGSLARDTVFATVMIVGNGVVGLCLLLGAIRHRVLEFQVEGTGQALSVLASLTTLTLVLPALTTTTAGPTYSPAQLAFAGVVSLLLYAVFVFVQTVRHREYFLPVVADGGAGHVPPPSAVAFCVFLFLSVVP